MPNPKLKLIPVQILTAFVQLYIVTVTIFAPSPSAKAPLPGWGPLAEAAVTYIASNENSYVLHVIHRYESVVPGCINPAWRRPSKSPAFQRSSKQFKANVRAQVSPCEFAHCPRGAPVPGAASLEWVDALDGPDAALLAEVAAPGNAGTVAPQSGAAPIRANPRLSTPRKEEKSIASRPLAKSVLTMPSLFGTPFRTPRSALCT